MCSVILLRAGSSFILWFWLPLLLKPIFMCFFPAISILLEKNCSMNNVVMILLRYCVG